MARTPCRRSFSMALALALWLPVAKVEAVDVLFTPPELNPGMASIEAMLEAAADEFIDDILSQVEAQLAKPLFMRAFSGAAATASLLPGLGGPAGGLTLSLGSAASAWSADYSAESLAFLANLGLDDDVEAGASIQPLLVQVSLSLDRLVPGLDAGAYAGFMDVQGAAYGVRSFAAGASAGFSLFAPESRFGSPESRARAPESRAPAIVAWQGLRLSLGFGFSAGTLSMRVAPGTIYQVIPIDLDGSGPLVPLSTTIEVEPEVLAGVSTTALGGRAAAMTGFTFLRALSLSVGGGFGWFQGGSSISLESDDEIRVLGYLASLVREPGRIALSGSAAAVTTTAAYPFLAASLGFRVGAFGLSLPVAWSIPMGLGAAVLAELRI